MYYRITNCLQVTFGLTLGLCFLLLTTPGAAAEKSKDTSTRKKSSKTRYSVTLAAKLDPETATATLSLKIKQSRALLRELSLSAPKGQFRNFASEDADVTHNDDRVTWQVPKKGGTLTWTAALNIPRGNSWDARITDQWALLRFEDLLPRLRTTKLKGSTNTFRLLLDLPEGWTAETRYGRYTGESLRVKSSPQSFRRPTGWLVAGSLGVRRDKISKRDITVAAPKGSGFPRVPILAMLNWTLPELVKVFPNTPERVLIVSGDRSMWRGALSGPDSLYLHPDRPLISENGTSTLLHEIVHLATRWFAAPGDDWIVEGLAEYYSLEILRRSGGLSMGRYEGALEGLADWSKENKGGLTDPSKGPDTAYAVGMFAEIADEIGHDNLDAVVDHLTDKEGAQEVSRAMLAACIEDVTGKPSIVLKNALKTVKSN